MMGHVSKHMRPPGVFIAWVTPLNPFHCVSSKRWMLRQRSGLATEVDESSHRELEQLNTIKDVILYLKKVN